MAAREAVGEYALATCPGYFGKPGNSIMVITFNLS